MSWTGIKTELTYNGRSQSLSDWAKELRIDSNLIQWRLKSGWSVEEALSRPVREDILISYQGKTATVTQWAKELGISPQAIYCRLKKGWDTERVLFGNHAKGRVIRATGKL